MRIKEQEIRLNLHEHDGDDVFLKINILLIVITFLTSTLLKADWKILLLAFSVQRDDDSVFARGTNKVVEKIEGIL